MEWKFMGIFDMNNSSIYYAYDTSGNGTTITCNINLLQEHHYFNDGICNAIVSRNSFYHILENQVIGI